jgi:glutamate synthase (ferredoxin)
MVEKQTKQPHRIGYPDAQGLYDPAMEHDACGIGLVVNIKGHKSHKIVSDSLAVLRNLSHRGGAGYERNSGDGAGILTQIPHRFFVEVCPDSGINLPPEGGYGVGMVFLPQKSTARAMVRSRIERIVFEEGLTCLGWRDIPVDVSSLGSISRSVMPHISQLFVARGRDMADDMDFERRLYVVRKRAEKANAGKSEGAVDYYYFASLSCRTIVYKGMLTSEQVEPFFLDLSHPAYESALSVVHSRFSTNTFPAGNAPIPTATSSTTARSTPCAAT